MYCKICRKNVRSISHFPKVHKSYLRRRKAAAKIRRSPKKGGRFRGWKVRNPFKRYAPRGRRPPGAWFERTVEALERRGDVDDPEALANWIWHYWKR